MPPGDRSTVTATRIHRHVNAPRAAVYRALLDARAVARATDAGRGGDIISDFDTLTDLSYRVNGGNHRG